MFHLVMNLGWGIQHTFEGNQSTADYSTIYHSKKILERKNIPSHRAPIHHVKELICHSFDSRVVGLLLVHLRRSGVASNFDSATAHIGRCTPQQLLQIITVVREQCLASEPHHFRMGEEFYSHVKFMELADVFMTLLHAVKYADISLLRRVINQCCFSIMESKPNAPLRYFGLSG